MEQIELKEQVSVAINPRTWSADPVGAVTEKVAALAKVDELGALLLRMKYGDDKRRSGMLRAVLLLAKRERSSVRFRRGKYIAFKREQRESPHDKPNAPMADIIERFAAAVLEAWLDDTCGACHGRGTVGGKETVRESTVQCVACNGRGAIRVDVGVTVYCAWPHGVARNEPISAERRYAPPTENLPIVETLVRRERDQCAACRGLGRLARREDVMSRQACAICGGSGKRWQIPAQRAHAMQISLGQYQAHWHDRFESSLRMLAALDEWTDLQLRKQLRAQTLADRK
ncbi:conserved protein of unknown function [Burkholderia multivorans]